MLNKDEGFKQYEEWAKPLMFIFVLRFQDDYRLYDDITTKSKKVYLFNN